MIEALMVINLATSKLCVYPNNIKYDVECWQIAHGCPDYPTPTGSFNVEAIYTNASLVDFKTGRDLGSDIIGGLLVDLGESPTVPGARFALHGWHKPITSEMCSHSCIRINTNALQNIIQTFYFKTIKIN